MHIKIHPPMTVLFNTHQTSLADLGNFANDSVRELYRYVADLDLMVCGPQYWFYYGLSGRQDATVQQSSAQQAADQQAAGQQTSVGKTPDRQTPDRHVSGQDASRQAVASLDARCTLEVALPIHGRIPTALIPYCKEIPSLRALSYVHEGSWKDLSSAHQAMHNYIREQGLLINGIYAEVYLNIDPEHPERNITEIRIGLND